MDSNSIAWKEYEISIDMHKTYLDFVVKLNIFYYGITGAILSFHFAKESPTVSLIGLLLPIILSLSLGVFFLYSTKLALNLKENITQRAAALGLTGRPDGIVLVLICFIFGSTMLSVGLSLIAYLIMV